MNMLLHVLHTDREREKGALDSNSMSMSSVSLSQLLEAMANQSQGSALQHAGTRLLVSFILAFN